MYLYHHYTKQARNTLRGIATDTNGNILSVRDGDNSITFVNKNEVTKVYKSLANDSYDKMLRMIQSYNSYNASPRQVGGVESFSEHKWHLLIFKIRNTDLPNKKTRRKAGFLNSVLVNNDY